MIREDIREELNFMGFEETVVFDNPSFDNSIIGYTDDERIVYDYDKMVEEFSSENGCTTFEAIEFIDYNTLRALPYAEGKAPIIIYKIPTN